MRITEAVKEIESIKVQLIQKYRPDKIILFGSAARGEDEINDIDLLIIKGDVPYYGIDRMRELDNIIERNVAADMLVYKPDEVEARVRMGDSFVKKILAEGRVIYG